MLGHLRDYLARQPACFTLLRKLIEFNFPTQKHLIGKCLGNRVGLRVLDIGCGTGEFASVFAAHEYHGIDISPAYIAYAQGHHQATFSVMDATRLQFPDASFEFVLVMAILHHLPDHEALQALTEAARVLVPGGMLLVMEDARIPQLENRLVRLVQRYDKGEYMRSPDEYRRLMGEMFDARWETTFRNGGCVYYAFHGVKLPPTSFR